jgi:hypothetical protein
MASDLQILGVENGALKYESGTFKLYSDSWGREGFVISEGAFGTLLNMVKVPIKFFYRINEMDTFVAQDSVNVCLKNSQGIGAVVVDKTITQFCDTKKTYLPLENIQASIAEKYDVKRSSIYTTCENDIYTSLFPLDIESLPGTSLSLRIQFSEYFEIVPRIDVVVVFDKTFDTFVSPIRGRKIRVSGLAVSTIVSQILEFCDIVIEQTQKTFLPGLEQFLSSDMDMNANSFALEVCNVLRIKRAIAKDMVEGIDSISSVDILKGIMANLQPEIRKVDVNTARSIELAISHFIVNGAIK